MAAAAVAAIHGAKRGREMGQRIAAANISKLAHEASVKAEKQRKLADGIVSSYDTDHSGKLSRVELPPMLRDYAKQVYGEDGHLPSEDDVKFLVTLCDRPTAGGGPGDGQIDRKEVLDVCFVWADFIEQQSTISQLMKKHDQDFDGQLSEEELGTLLNELDGKEVPLVVVSWIFQTSDVSKSNSLSGLELARAICAMNMWKEDLTQGNPVKYIGSKIDVPQSLPKHQKSCCVVS
eukprot:TRINITY_DN114295_c0_g1_i1.p1 TRINITY_DN114295_c0_g1~~TRINITY_DN114295_c0_g1_i1.p1  ORF type:complete len:253 (-),score=53.91 TRINITY_DN114295_c0_g1_i1:154-855(-)